MPFLSYKVIDGATHNYHDKSLEDLVIELEKLI